ncbi:MFS general substrate transporter, partial [Violaceomyces palustris]
MSTPVEQARSRSTNASMKEEDRNPGVDKLMTTTILDYVHPDDEEKGESGEAVQGSTISSSVDEAYEIVGEVKVEYTLEEQREVRKKIDKVVPGLLAVVYLSQYLDKTSLSYSAVTGLPITGSQYNLVSMSFYLGYLIWEFPTQWIAQKVNPTMYLGFNIVAWSVCLALHAAAPNFAPFFALRFLTGMFESVVAPVLIMTIVAFYPREEQAVRISSFYLMNGFAEIFGGLLAWSITFYTGNSIAHWRIIYIILGGLALLVGIVVMIWLPASPTSARFLNEKEKRVALERVRSNASGTVQHRFKPHQAVEALKDTKVWLNLALVIVVSVPNGALSNFSSIIIKNLGYD